MKLRNQTNNRHSRGFENWTAENDCILLKVGVGLGLESTVRRRKNWHTFTNEITCNTYKTHLLKTKP